MFLGLWAVRILLSLLTAMGFFITTFNGVLAQDQPPITSNFSGIVYFQPVSSTPRPLSLLMCLTIFTWMPWNARLLVGAFSKSSEGSQIMQPLHLFLLVFVTTTLVISLMGIISEPLQRASTCVPAVAEPPGFEKVWIWPWTEPRAWPR